MSSVSSSVSSTPADPPAVRVGLLGPVALWVDGADVEVPGAKRRLVLALLALADGAAVPLADLVDALWPDAPPADARGAIQNHMSRLRGHLDPAGDRVISDRQGYRLELAPGELDVDTARRSLDTARSLADDDASRACSVLESARALWRGRPLAEFDDVLPLAPHVVALTELRRDIDALLVGTALAVGDTELALRAAGSARSDDPDGESATLLYMKAAAAAGRADDALAAGAELRSRRRADGIEPTPELDAMERAIASRSAAAADRPPVRPDPPRLTPSDSIPLATTPLIGRESEIAALRRLLDGERFVTIVGTGGVGKTRLAAEVARRDDGDVHFVGLAPLTDPGDLPRALAASLGLESVRGDALDACIRLLAAGPRLLVLDNCEHVLGPARDVITTLLRGCPSLTLLTTSRERLGLADEASFRLGPLAVPDATSEHPERSAAMALFVDRARRARSGVDLDPDEVRDAVAIVRALEGVPLAIELAAGRLSSLTVSDVRDRLGRALDLLRGGRSATEARHRTLRATLEWSYELLPDDRRRLVRHLAVFPDGVDLATAEQLGVALGVEGDPAAALAHLVDASMLDADLAGESRYRMLETLRSFGLEQLDATGERDAAEQRLLQWAVTFTAWVDATLQTSDEAVADRRLHRELANLRAAWALAIRRADLDAATAMIVALDDAAQWRELPEVWTWAETLADHPALRSHQRAAAALATTSDLVWLQGNLTRATELAEAALACAADEEGRWRSMLALSVARLSAGEFRSAADLALEAAAITTRPEHARLVAALATAYAGDFDTAEQINARDVAPGGITQQAEWEYTAGELASIAGRHDEAERHYRRAIATANEVGASFVVAIAWVGLMTVLRSTGRRDEALRTGGEALDYWVHAGNWIQTWTTLRNVAAVLVDLGDVDTARALLSTADRAPDAPAVGDSAWDSARLDPGDAPSAPAISHDDVVDLARSAIARHLPDWPSASP